MNIPSKILENAVDQIASLPGIGKKTALRLALSLLKRRRSEIADFVGAIDELKKSIQLCNICYNLSDDKTCKVCSNPIREQGLICIVEDIRDVMAIESTNQFKGVYHVLGGIISPMDGVGPSDIRITELVGRINNNEVPINEVILALSTTMEGDTTAFYIYRKLQESGIEISIIARGVSIGDELEYIDEITLGRSILQRTPYQNSLYKQN
jgi:recombination protein RecR